MNDILGSVWAVLAALIGSCGALIAGTASLVHSRRQLRLSFEQQAEQARIGREMSLRRDVYLEAAQAMARATSSLNELADIDSESEGLARQYATDFAMIAKVHIVGLPDTIEALMRVTRELGNAQAELNAARIPLLARQRRMNAGVADPQELDALTRKHLEARLEIAELAMVWMRKVGEHIPDAVIAIRRELQLPLMESSYRDEFQRNWENNQQLLRKRIDRIRGERKP